MLAISSNELKQPLGNYVDCKFCGSRHEVEYGDEVMSDGTKVPSKLLAFYTCGEKSYLCGINGMSI